MNLLDALKETEMAEAEFGIGLSYIGYDGGRHLRWFYKSSKQVHCEPDKANLESINWVPYKPYYHKPEKCEACYKADRLNAGERSVKAHLRTPAPLGHCTCKES